MRRNAQGEQVAVIESQPVAVEVIPDNPNDPNSGLASLGVTGGGSPVIGAVEDRQHEAEVQAQVPELTARPDAPQLVIPELRMTVVESHFSLADITDSSEFRRLGERLARDPVGELRRIRLSAHVVETLDGLRHTTLAPSRTIDRLESPASLIPLEDAVKRVADQVLASSAVPARKGQRAQLGRLLEAFITGLGDNAELILSGYGDRAAAGLIQLIATEQRRFASKPRYDEVLALRPFNPVRHGRPTTSTDRFGAFKRGVGYLGWQRSLFEQVWFDSGTERELANLVDDTSGIDVWARLHVSDLPIRWDGGSYNPDFLIAAGAHRYVVETKADRDLQNENVKGKREAAQRWANHVSSDAQTTERWHYLLVGETDLRQAKDDWEALVSAAR